MLNDGLHSLTKHPVPTRRREPEPRNAGNEAISIMLSLILGCCNTFAISA
jgi:hypothetical protein